jgi:hypothetical protein
MAREGEASSKRRRFISICLADAVIHLNGAALNLGRRVRTDVPCPTVAERARETCACPAFTERAKDPTTRAPSNWRVQPDYAIKSSGDKLREGG